MISRPVVAAPLAGLLLGDPVSGMWAGLLLEVLTLRQLPVGGARYWDSGPAAVAAAAAAVSLPDGSAGLVVALGVGVLVGWAGGWSVYVMRGLNARLVAPLGEGPAPPSRLVIRHLSAMAVDFVRAGTLTMAAVWIVGRLSGGVVGFAEGGRWIGGLVLLAAASLALGVDLRTMTRGRAAWAAFGAGAFVSLALWVAFA